MSYIDGGEEALRFMKGYLGFLKRGAKGTEDRVRQTRKDINEFLAWRRKRAEARQIQENLREAEENNRKSAELIEQAKALSGNADGSPIAGKNAGPCVQNMAALIDNTTAELQTCMSPEEAKACMQKSYFGQLCELPGDGDKCVFPMESRFVGDFVKKSKTENIPFIYTGVTGANIGEGMVPSLCTITIDSSNIQKVKEFYLSKGVSFDDSSVLLLKKEALIEPFKEFVQAFYDECDKKAIDEKTIGIDEKDDKLIKIGDEYVSSEKFREIQQRAENMTTGKTPDFPQLSEGTDPENAVLSERSPKVSRIDMGTEELLESLQVEGLDKSSSLSNMDSRLTTMTPTNSNQLTHFEKGLSMFEGNHELPKSLGEDGIPQINPDTVNFVCNLKEKVKGEYVISLDKYNITNIKNFLSDDSRNIDSRQLLIVNNKEYLALDRRDVSAFNTLFRDSNKNVNISAADIKKSVVIGNQREFSNMFLGSSMVAEHKASRENKKPSFLEGKKFAEEKASKDIAARKAAELDKRNALFDALSQFMNSQGNREKEL